MKDDSLRSQNEKKQKLTQNQIKPVSKFTINGKCSTIIPHLMKKNYQSIKNLNTFDKIRSHSQSLQSEKYKKIQHQTAVTRHLSQHKHIQRQKTIELNLNERKTLNQFIRNQEFSQKQKTSKQCILIQNHENQQNLMKNTFSSIIAQKKQVVSIKTYQTVGVSTDLQINGQAYKQFLKFKITQKQKYQKMNQIFQFIDNISLSQKKCFNQRFQKVNKNYQQKFQNERQKKTIETCKVVKKSQQRLNEIFDKMIQKMIKIQQQIYQVSLSQITNINQQLKKLKKTYIQLAQNKQNLIYDKQNLVQGARIDPSLKLLNNELIQNKKQSKSTKFSLNQNIDLEISKITKMCVNFQNFTKQKHEQVNQRLIQTRGQLNKYLQNWKFALNEKNYSIKICVEDIMRLPEMSLSIFGMQNDNKQTTEIDMMKKIGVALDQIPQFDKFYNKSVKLSAMDSALRQMINYKCLNCAYLKSKMRYIYMKNKQLYPVMKILNYLVKDYSGNKL